MTDALDQAELLHLGANDFDGPRSDAISSDKIDRRREELLVSVLDLQPKGDECALVVPVVRKENTCEVVQS